MKKILLTMVAAAAMWTPSIAIADSGTTSVPVKMTYVDGTNCVLQKQTEITNNTDEVFGEIKEGDTAIAGYNKISGSTVGFGTAEWGVNYITYLQVDISEISGNIISANLSFEATGSTDGKRTTTWGVGYNNSVWSSAMSYNTADKTITVLGDTKSGSTKSAGTFENYTFDITDAVNNAGDDGLVTILIYETAAAGGYVKNPKVDVAWTTASTYHISFKETNGADITVKIDGIDVTSGTEKTNGTYSFNATAGGYKDYTGEFTVAGADQEVEFTMTPKETWNFSVKNNVNDDIITGSCFEGESGTVAYHRYILASDGIVWMKDKASNQEYHYTFTPTQNNAVETITYSETDKKDGIYFIEGEEIEGMTATSNGNAGVRASNAQGGWAEEAIQVYQLKPGKYKVEIAASGSKDKTLSVTAGSNPILSYKTTGSWGQGISEEFTILTPTDLTFEGARDGYPLDYILITGTVYPSYKVLFVDENGKTIKEDVRTGAPESAITLHENDLKSFTEDDIYYVYETNDLGEKTIAADGSTVVTIKFHKAKEFNYTVQAVMGDAKVNIATGKCMEGESVKVPYSRYILAADGKVWKKEHTSTEQDETTVKEYNISITPDKDNYSAEIVYDVTEITDGIFFSEAEKINGMTEYKSARGSNAAGAYADGPVTIYNLKPGTYSVTIGYNGVVGAEGEGLTLTAGEQTVLSATPDGEWHELSEDFTLNKASDLVFSGSSASRRLDYILINGHEANENDQLCTIQYVVDGKVVKEATTSGEFGKKITLTASQKKGFFAEGVKYMYVSDNSSDVTISADGNNVITVTCRIADKYKYTVANNINDAKVTGECYEGESVSVPYGRYILSEGTAYRMLATDGDYYFRFTPDKNDYVATLTYEEYSKEAILFSEAEAIESLTPTKAESQAFISCSNLRGGYSQEAAVICTLKPGTYKIAAGIFGEEGATIIMKAGEKTLLSKATNGNWAAAYSEEFSVAEPTDIMLEGTDATHPLDFILVTGKEIHDYTLNYVVDNQIIKATTKSGLTGDATVVTDEEKANFYNEDKSKKYIFVSEDSEGKTIANNDKTFVTLTYRLANTNSYTVKSKLGDVLINSASDKCHEGDAASFAYSRYILHTDGSVWIKKAAYGDKNSEYNYPFTPTTDGHVETLEYTKHATDGIFFKEAEDMDGMTETDKNNAKVRCSGAKAGYAADAVTVHTLKPGTYKVTLACWGNAGATFVVKAGNQTVHTATTNGSWTESTSPEFTLDEETPITFEGANASHPLDYILITGKADGTTAVNAIEAEGLDVWYNLQGVKVPAPTSKGIYIHNGKKVIIR